MRTSIYTNSITQKWGNKCASSAKVNNKLENICRDQENINCYMEGLKGGQPNETARKKKKKSKVTERFETRIH